MENELKERPLLTDDMLMDFEEKIHDHSITIAECKLIEHYYSTLQGSGHLLDLLEQVGVDSIPQATRILRNGSLNFEKVNDYPSVYGLFLGCIEFLQRHLNRGEKIQ